MPEINIKVKIIGGKRTPLEVYVDSMAVNSKSITFQSGVTLSDTDFAAAINDAVIAYLGRPS